MRGCQQSYAAVDISTKSEDGAAPTGGPVIREIAARSGKAKGMPADIPSDWPCGHLYFPSLRQMALYAPDCRCHRWRKRVEHHLAQRDMEFAQQLGIMAAQLISQFDTQGTAGSRLAWLQGVVETEVEQVDADIIGAKRQSADEAEQHTPSAAHLFCHSPGNQVGAVGLQPFVLALGQVVEKPQGVGRGAAVVAVHQLVNHVHQPLIASALDAEGIYLGGSVRPGKPGCPMVCAGSLHCRHPILVM